MYKNEDLKILRRVLWMRNEGWKMRNENRVIN